MWKQSEQFDDKSQVSAIVYPNEGCITFESIGPRGGNVKHITLPFSLIEKAVQICQEGAIIEQWTCTCGQEFNHRWYCGWCGKSAPQLGGG